MPCSDLPEYDFTLYKGDDKTLSFRWKTDGVPVDITGYVINFECTELTLNQTAVLVDPTDGRYDFVFSSEVTAAIASNRIMYEVVFYPSNLLTNKTTMYGGSINFTGEVLL